MSNLQLSTWVEQLSPGVVVVDDQIYPSTASKEPVRLAAG